MSSNRILAYPNFFAWPLQHLSNNNVEQTTTLATRIQDKKRELLHLLGQAEHPNCAMDLENKKLLHVLRQAPGPLPG
jgi:hypothetical protein